MNTQNNSCDHQRIDDFLNSDHVALDDAQLVAHLDTCAACREHIETKAAEAQRWTTATELLKPTEFDRAGSVGCSAATIGNQRLEQPIAAKSVLTFLAPSDDPTRLGRLGGYEVSGVVGVGGMGVVLKAFDPALDRVVAIKVMGPHLANNGTARKRFSREAKAAAAVLHPNVVPIHGVSDDEAIPYLVMSYIRGGSLQKRLRREGPLTTVEVLRIGSQVAAGLAAAHEQGLVHRDIKPENILLEDGVERVTLTDFGLARAVDDVSVTRDGTIAGTPQYMSPEQARGESVDQTSDLFSLGSVLYSLCTGRPPFRADTSYGVMRRIIDEAPVPIREINPEIPDWLVQIIDKLMAKNRAERYASAGEVHKLLEACLSHVQQPTHTELPDSLRKPPSPTQSQRRATMTPHPKRMILIMTVLAVSTLLFAFIPLVWNDSSEEARMNFTQANAQLHSTISTGDPTNAVRALLENTHGRQYLVELDKQLKHFTYDDRLSLDGESAGAVFIWNRNDDDPHAQTLVRCFSGDGTGTGLSVGLPIQFHVDALRIVKDKLVIGYTVSDREEDKLSIQRMFELIPGESYVTEVDVVALIEDTADWIEPFKNGRLAKRSDLNEKQEPPERADRDRDRDLQPTPEARTKNSGVQDGGQPNAKRPRHSSLRSAKSDPLRRRKNF